MSGFLEAIFIILISLGLGLLAIIIGAWAYIEFIA
jgi:hypothetical protein